MRALWKDCTRSKHTSHDARNGIRNAPSLCCQSRLVDLYDGVVTNFTSQGQRQQPPSDEPFLDEDIEKLKAEAKLAAEVAAETAEAVEAATVDANVASDATSDAAAATPTSKTDDIMAAATKAAEDPFMPLVSSRMLMARSLVARQEQLHDRLGSIRRQFSDIDIEVTSLRNSRYAHYSQWEERRRQQAAHAARAKLLTH